MKKVMAVLMALALLCVGASALGEGQRGNGGGRPNGNGGRGGMGGGVDKSADSALQAMIAEVAPRFELMTYADEETGATLQYQLFIPEDYDDTKRYPLIQFIPDSSVVGRGAEAVLTQGWAA